MYFPPDVARDVLDALRLLEGRLVGSGRKLSPGALELRAVAERSRVDARGQRSTLGPDSAHDGPVPTMLTIAEVAEAIRQSQRTVRRRVAAGRLTAVHDGRSLRFRHTDVERYVDALQ